MKLSNNFSNNYSKLNNKPSFGQAQVNIIATSDNHGKFDPMPKFYSNIVHNNETLFPKANEKSTLNVGVFNGDWFMDPSKGGFVTDSTKIGGDYQLKFLNTLIGQIKEIVPNFKALYVPGNHCFDGGDKLLVDYLKDADMTTVLTNASFNKSPLLKDLTPEERQKIKQLTVLEVPDDKKTDKLHKVLVLGVAQMGVDFYNPGLVDGIDIIDRTDKKDAKIKEEDLKNTFSVLDSVIKNFKKSNPKGAVVVMSHTGKAISKMLANNVNGINVILNGHDHKDEDEILDTKNGKQVHIISLADDSKKIDALNIHFDDKGNYDNFGQAPTKIYTADALPLEDNPFEPLLEESFKEDKKPLLHISGDKGITKLAQKNVRKDNNLLANFVTDGILDSIKKINPKVQIFGVASSAFRQDLAVNDFSDNLQLRNVMNGQTDGLSKIYTADLKGSDIAKMVIENLLDHKKDMERNTIVQWSGLQISKIELLNAIDFGRSKNLNTIKDFIKIKDENGEYKALDLNQTYTTAMPNYFFLRPKLPTAQANKPLFKPLTENLNKGTAQKVLNDINGLSIDEKIDYIGEMVEESTEALSMDQLFRRYLENNDFNVKMPDTNDVRIKQLPSLQV